MMVSSLARHSDRDVEARFDHIIDSKYKGTLLFVNIIGFLEQVSVYYYMVCNKSSPPHRHHARLSSLLHGFPFWMKLLAPKPNFCSLHGFAVSK